MNKNKFTQKFELKCYGGNNEEKQRILENLLTVSEFREIHISKFNEGSLRVERLKRCFVGRSINL